MDNYDGRTVRAIEVVMDLIITRQNVPDELMHVDATLRESHDDQATLASRPVERGIQVTDHIQVQPATLSADMFFSDSPLDPPPTNTPAGWTINPTVSRVADQQATTLTPTGPAHHVSNVYGRLLAMLNDGALCELTTSLRNYKDMVCTQVSAPRASGDGDGVTISCTWTQIRFATTKTVPVTAAPRHKPKKDKGPQPTAETDPFGITAQKSWAQGGIDLIKGLF